MSQTPCTPCADQQNPPLVLPSGKYIVIIDQYGNTAMLARPLTQSLLIFDGDDTYFADGSDEKPINLNSLKKVNSVAVLNGLLGLNAAGRFFNLVNETSAKMTFKSQGGQVFLESDGSTPGGPGTGGLPTTGYGVLIKVGNNEPVWLGDVGLIYIGADGTPIALPGGGPNTLLTTTIVGQAPQWKAPPSGNIAAGAGSVDLSGVMGSATDDVVTINVPSFGLTDGTNDLTVANVSIAVNLAVVGIDGLDVPARTADNWYYIYIISDGTNVHGVASLSPTLPAFTDPSLAGYSFYGLASVARNDSTNKIRQYLQRGRRITHAPIQVTNGQPAYVTFNAVIVAIPLNTIFPPSVKTCSGTVGGSGTGTLETITTIGMVMAANAAGIGMQHVGSFQTSAVVEGFKRDMGSFFDLPIANPVSPVLYWRASEDASSPAARRMTIWGYTI